MPIIILTLFIILVLTLLLYFKLKNSSGFRSWFFQLTEDSEDVSSEEAIEQAEKAREGVSRKKREALARIEELEREKKALHDYLGEDDEDDDKEIDNKAEEEGRQPDDKDE
jgi:hypothetical protein